jgi:uncharacterized protein YndB with AHSA1/START domain
MQPAEQEVVITRVFDAPIELVWKAWTEPERMQQWWGPQGWTLPVCKLDVRVGGVLHFCMRGPDGQVVWGTGVYREVVPLERLVHTDSFSDADGNVVSAEHYGMSPDWPLEMLVTVTFVEDEGKTTVTVRHGTGAVSAEDRGGAEQGWSESLDRLAEYLAAA